MVFLNIYKWIRGDGKVIGLSIIAALGLNTCLAQEGVSGNTTVAAGGQSTFFGNLGFLTGGSGSQPGVILTERSSGQISYVNFSGSGLLTTGASDANHVDGYVKKFGTGSFIFPVGDNGILAPFVAYADGISGAYFRADPSVAVTSNRFNGGNYAPLPSGAPFPATNKSNVLTAISGVEYWDIDGDKSTRISLTWKATSNIAALTSNTLTNLSIAGWTGTEWVKIPSVVDVTSLLGGTSTLTTGSITTTNAFLPSTYSVYTLAASIPDPNLQIRLTVTPNRVSGTKRLEVLVAAVTSSASGTISGTTITLRVRKNTQYLSKFQWNQNLTSSSDGTSVQNSIWTQTEDNFYYYFKTITVIPKGSQRRLLFTIELNPGASNGDFPLNASIPPGTVSNPPSGGQVNETDDQDTEIIEFTI